LLIFGVFATNSVVGCFYVSYERHFVKKIQHFCALKEQERNDTSLAPFALTARQLIIYRLPMVLPWAIFLLGLRPVFARKRGWRNTRFFIKIVVYYSNGTTRSGTDVPCNSVIIRCDKHYTLIKE